MADDATRTMTPVASSAPSGYAAMIGDVVGSRDAGDELFEDLDAALSRTNAAVDALQPLQITIGDEFQGVYRDLGKALNATMLVRLLLHDVADVRFGVGWGGFTRWNPERAPFEQDGPAWWAARDALEAAEHHESATGVPTGWRTELRLATPADTGPPRHETEPAALRGLPPPSAPGLELSEAVEALLMCRDHIFARLDDRDARLVRAVLEGASVTRAAQDVGISQQAASRRLRNNGGYALLRIWRLLGEQG